MRLVGGALLCAFLIGFAVEADAISVPVDGNFGTAGGCAILKNYGAAAVAIAGGTDTFPERHKDDGETILVTPDEAVGSDWVCRPGTVDGEYVALLCVTMGATWVPMPVAHFKVDGDTLRFTMPDEPTATLQRCGQ